VLASCPATATTLTAPLPSQITPLAAMPPALVAPCVSVARANALLTAVSRLGAPVPHVLLPLMSILPGARQSAVPVQCTARTLRVARTNVSATQAWFLVLMVWLVSATQPCATTPQLSPAQRPLPCNARMDGVWPLSTTARHLSRALPAL
jgi:hypothetical protein